MAQIKLMAAFLREKVLDIVQRIRTRQWLAERWDQKTYGLQKAQQININVQDLRMAALRHVEVVDDLSTEKGQ